MSEERYRPDALYMTEDTSVDEVVDYLQECLENPIFSGDSVVWNFSTHPIQKEQLNVEGKQEDHFVIPYQVTGPWGFMFSLLPDVVRRAETLVYKPDSEEYHAYKSLYRETTGERRDQISQDLARRLELAEVEL